MARIKPRRPRWLKLIDLTDESCSLDDTNGELDGLRELICPVEFRDPGLWIPGEHWADVHITCIYGTCSLSGVMWSITHGHTDPAAEAYVRADSRVMRIDGGGPVSAGDAQRLMDETTVYLALIWGNRMDFWEPPRIQNTTHEIQI